VNYLGNFLALCKEIAEGKNESEVILTVALVGGSGLGSDYEALQADYDALQQQSSGLSSQLQQVQSDLTSLQSDYDELNADYEQVSQQLADIEGVGPARHFSSLGELQNWLLLNDVSGQPWATTYEGWYGKELQIQEDAARDGFLVSVQYHFCDERQVIEYIACVAVAGGYLYMWDPQSDQVFRDSIWANVRVK